MLCTVHPVVGCAYVIVLHQQPARSLSNIEPVCLRCVCALRCSRLCAALRWWCLMQPAAARRVVSVSVCSSSLTLLSSLTTVYLIFSSSCLPVSSSVSSSRVCTCAPYCCCSIPRHLGCLVPCIPSAAALTTKLSVYSKSTPQQASLPFCPCHPRARSSFLPAPPRSQESVGAA